VTVPEKLVILTDLDGTLLDRKTYQAGPALPYLKKCRELAIPAVFVTAKSKAEVEPIRKELDNDEPFICENGGGIYIPANKFPHLEGFEKIGEYWCRCSDKPIDELLMALDEISKKLVIDVKSFSQMTIAEVAELTGLTPHQAQLAKIRKFDEPFIIINQTPEKLAAIKSEIINQGYSYTSGGYLHHIKGNFDKGVSVELLKRIYLQQNPLTKFASIGDAANDLPMLELVDYPFLVKRPDGNYDQNAKIEGSFFTESAGPAGFAEAVDYLLKNIYKK
jgi:mannosyl-3-phosphoglycerate phosphatase